MAPKRAPAEEPDAKRRRLDNLVGTRGVSQRGLVEVARKLAEAPGPVTRQDIQSHLAATLNEVSDIVKLPMQDGTEFEWTVGSADKLLRYVAGRSETFNALLSRAVASAGGEPLRMILYMDEVTPGDALALWHGSKFWAMYFIFLDFGPDMLQCEALWLPIAVLKHDTCVGVDGGLSCAVRLLLRHMLLGPGGLARQGAGVQLGGAQKLVRARLVHLLADMDAHRALWLYTGASGYRPCMRCANICMKKGRPAPGEFSILCSRWAHFAPQTDEDVWKLFDDLGVQKATLGKTAYKALETKKGLHYHPLGLLADKELREHVKPSMMAYDPMHNLWANGVVGVEVGCFLKACKKKLKVTFADVRRFVQKWTLPKCRRGGWQKAMFSKSHESSCAKHFRAGASELIGCFPLVVAFAEERIAPNRGMQREVESLRACARMVDLAMAGKSLQRTSVAECIASMEVLMDSHQAAYGSKHIKPKHHYAFHNAAEELKALDCFATERHNKMLKAVGDCVNNHTRLEEAVLGGALLEQVRQLEAMKNDDCALEGKGSASEELRRAFGARECHVAWGMRYRGRRFDTYDVVRAESGEFYYVEACARVDGIHRLVIREFVVASSGPSETMARLQQSFRAVDPGRVLNDVHAWRTASDGCHVILHRDR